MMLILGSKLRFKPADVIPRRTWRTTRAINGISSFRSYSCTTATRSYVSAPLHYEWIDPKTSSSSSSSTATSLSSFQQQQHNIVFLHGLLGNGRNLRTFAKQFCQRQNARGLLIDLPGHGKSKQQFSSSSSSSLAARPVTFDDCVDAVGETLQAVGVVDDNLLAHAEEMESNNSNKFTLVGHSLGGRVALHYADSYLRNNDNNIRQHPQPSRLILLDTVPGKPNESVTHVVRTAEQIILAASTNNKSNGDTTTKPATSMTRNELANTLQEHPHGLDPSTAQWLASMFDVKRGEFSFDVQVAKDLLHDFDREFVFHDDDLEENTDSNKKNNSFVDRKERVLTNHPSIRRIDLVRGGKNKGWEADSVRPQLQRMETWTEMMRPAAVVQTKGGTSTTSSTTTASFHMHVLPNAGHWVHVDDLGGLLDALHV